MEWILLILSFIGNESFLCEGVTVSFQHFTTPIFASSIILVPKILGLPVIQDRSVKEKTKSLPSNLSQETFLLILRFGGNEKFLN